MPEYVVPTSRELLSIAPEKTARLIADRLAFKLMPIVPRRVARLVYEQRDKVRGLQKIRGYNGEFQRVVQVGGKQYDYVPGVYGEYMLVDEREMSIRRAYGGDGPIDATDLVLERQDVLMQRRLDRMEWAIWQVLVTGTISVADEDGTVQFTDTFATQTFAAGTAWATTATATPLANFRAIGTQGRGVGAEFGKQAVAIMNRTTANNMLANSNAADIGGKRMNGGNTVNSLDQFNQFSQLEMGDDLPRVIVYDEGYDDEAGAFVNYIPDGKVVVIGKRNKGVIGEFISTINANNPNGAPGPYQEAIPTKAPVSVKVYDGINGGPCLYYPRSVLVMNV